MLSAVVVVYTTYYALQIVQLTLHTLLCGSAKEFLV